MVGARKRLRAPGESLRRQLEALDDQLTPELIVAFVGPFMFASLILVQQRSPQHAMGVVGLALNIIVGVVAFGVACWRLARLRKRRVGRRLGFLGERAVGEELNLLMREGATSSTTCRAPPRPTETSDLPDLPRL